MKEYVKMYPTNLGELKENGMLVSEPFDTEMEAESFAKAIAHNYKCKTQIVETPPPTAYVVMADNFELYQIRSNFREDIQGYIFANGIFEHRK